MAVELLPSDSYMDTIPGCKSFVATTAGKTAFKIERYHDRSWFKVMRNVLLQRIAVGQLQEFSKLITFLLECLTEIEEEFTWLEVTKTK